MLDVQAEILSGNFVDIFACKAGRVTVSELRKNSWTYKRSGLEGIL